MIQHSIMGRQRTAENKKLPTGCAVCATAIVCDQDMTSLLWPEQAIICVSVGHTMGCYTWLCGPINKAAGH